MDSNLFFTERQQKVLTILPLFTGFISATSSLCIIYLITTEDTRNKRRLQQQKDHLKDLQRKHVESLQVLSDLSETAGRRFIGVNICNIESDNEYNLQTLDSTSRAAATRSTKEIPTGPATCTIFSPRRRISVGSHSSNGSCNAKFVPVNRTFQRIMIGLSIFDLFTAGASFASTFPLPTETKLWMASGTTTTCAIQGMVLQAGLSSSLYSASLALYFVVTIVPNCNKWCVSMERIEPLFHAIPIVFAIGTVVVGIVFDSFNPLPLGFTCWLSEYPHGCSYETPTTDPSDSVQCVRGKHIRVLFWIFGAFPILTSYSIVLLSMIWMYFSVWHQLRKVELRHHEQQKELSTKSKERLRHVATQAFLYILVFFSSYICVAIQRYMALNNHDVGSFHIIVVRSLLYPSQGFFNLLVYLRPRYLEIRRTHSPKVSRIDATKILLGMLPEPDLRLQTRRCIASSRPRSTTRGAPSYTESINVNDLNAVQTNILEGDSDDVDANTSTQSNSFSNKKNSQSKNNSDSCIVVDECQLGSDATSNTIVFEWCDENDSSLCRRNSTSPTLLTEVDVCENREKMPKIKNGELYKQQQQQQRQKQQHQNSLNQDDAPQTAIIETTTKLFSSWPSVDEVILGNGINDSR